MKQTFDITRTSRKVLLDFLEQYSLEQLNAIPHGFNNNIIWNIGHIVVVQQMLVYKLSGLPMMVSEELVEKYKRGTKPGAPVSQSEVDQIKNLLFSAIDQTERDATTPIFKEFFPYTTMLGYTVTDALSAIEFNNYHEAVHIGFIMSIRKFIG